MAATHWRTAKTQLRCGVHIKDCLWSDVLEDVTCRRCLSLPAPSTTHPPVEGETHVSARAMRIASRGS